MQIFRKKNAENLHFCEIVEKIHVIFKKICKCSK